MGAALVAASIFTQGETALWLIVLCGLCNSIMWPVIFPLAIKGLGPFTKQGSSYLIMAIVGGALLPLLMGWLFSNRSSYSSPFGNGSYPPSYGSGWNRQSNDNYAGTMSSRTAGSSVSKSSSPVISQPAISPNAEKMAAKAKAISSPTQSQRSFGNSSTTSSSRSSTPTTASRPSSSGGFGRSTASSSSRSGGFSGGGK